MADIKRYPPYLPLIELGYKREAKRNILESKPERGPIKRRLLSTGVIDRISGTITLDEGQLREFEDFWENYISGGIDEFLYPDFVRTDDLRPARFIGNYSWTKNEDDKYAVAVELELLPW